MDSFFDLSDTHIQRGDEAIEQARREPIANCETCKRVCEPFPVYGGGKKRVLVIVACPSAADKTAGKLFSGYDGKFLRQHGFDNPDDYWVTAAVNCYSPAPDPDNEKAVKEYKAKMAMSIKACRKHLHKTVEELKPTVILVLGADAMDGLIGHKLSGRGLENATFADLLDERIPDADLQARLVITHDPFSWPEHEKNPAFEPSIISAAKYVWSVANKGTNWIYPVYSEYAAKCEITTDRQEALKILQLALTFDKAAFDWETTGLKPQAKGHKVKTASISNGLKSWAFVVFDDEEFKTAVRTFLLSGVKKIMQGAKYESYWSYNFFGCLPANVTWCTQVGAHVVHNRKKTNLKLGTYVKFGITGYDTGIADYLKSSKVDKAKYGANAFNQIDSAPLDELLLYNALDSLFTYYSESEQRRQLPQHLQAGAEFFTQASVELAKIESNGIHIDEYQLEQTKADLTTRMAKLEKAVINSPELSGWDKKSPFSLSATADLTHLLFNVMKYEAKEQTATGKPKGDKTSLEEYDLPIVQNVLAWRKLSKAKSTYVDQYQREVCNGKIHPFYNLDRVDTYRSSSDSPNIQNVPKRDKEVMKLIRPLIVAKYGAKIVEWDYKGVEVSMQACHTKDPELIRYVTDPTTDMHRDLAAKLYMRAELEVIDEERQATKNKFTFPTFYGSYWKNTAPGLWGDVLGTPTIEHLKDQGVRNLADFQQHVKQVEDWFWYDKFPASFEYKEKVIHDYEKTGYLEMPTGFRCYASLTRNQLLNYKNQGTGFHCLLWTLTKASKQFEVRKLKTNMFAQIHDAALAYVWPDEDEVVDELMYSFGTQRIREYWDWIIVPLSLEKSESPINGTWADMKKIGLLKGA